MKVEPLIWVAECATDIDGSKWSLNSESVRGEGRWWFLMERPAWSKDADLATIGRAPLIRRIEACRREHFKEVSRVAD